MTRIPDYGTAILKRVPELAGKKVLIVGDVGLDEYVLGQVRRISPEAPVPVVEVETEESRLGLSANVAQNVSSLGGTPLLVSVVGRDSAADQLGELLARAGVQPNLLVRDDSRPTTRKLRVMVQNHHIVRVDYEQRQFLRPELEEQVLARAREAAPAASAIVVQDYAKGVVSERLVQELVKIARAAGTPILVDPNRLTPLAYYRGVDLIKPNYEEAIALTGESADQLHGDSGLMERMGATLRQRLQAKNVVITRGKLGMLLFAGDRVVDLPTYARQVYDVTGAGDTVIAALALGWGAGLDLECACALANFAAGVVVGKVGCVPCSVEELVAYVQAQPAKNR
jgi:rfaE bifunctional protein kinase chain/domain